MEKKKKRIFHIIQIGTRDDFPSRLFDVVIVCVILLNLFATFFATFDIAEDFKIPIAIIEWSTVIIFSIEYLLRIWTAEYLYPQKNRWRAKLAFLVSFYGLIDLFTILPTYLPLVFPAGAVAFRMFRVIRIFRLFKINAKYDAFNIIVDVLKEKRKQLFSSLVMIAILMMAASLFMYSLENEAQPDKFKNAFSGIWWSASTILTIGYGDIAPITPMGKVMSMVISFLGVGMVAVPTGIISAGFVEQYQKVRSFEVEKEEHPLRFVTSVIGEKHPWAGRKIKEITLPPQLLLVLVIRAKDGKLDSDDDEIEELMPNGSLVLNSGDVLVYAAKSYEGAKHFSLREVQIKPENPWVGRQVKDLDISRLELIVSIERRGRLMIPNGASTIKSGDILVIYSRKNV